MIITIPVAQAKTRLQDNRTNHIKTYKLQLAAWQEKMKQYNRAFEEWASSGGDGPQPQPDFRPRNYRSDYNRILEQLRLHCGQHIELDEADYDKVVLNLFNWRGQFSATSEYYGVPADLLHEESVGDIAEGYDSSAIISPYEE